MINVNDILKKHGGDPESLLRLDGENGPELLPYATLTAARGDAASELRAVIGIYQWQNRPLITLVDGDYLGNDANRLDSIRRLLAMRGDAPYFAVLRSGTMTMYSVGLQDNACVAEVAIAQAEADLRMVIPHLANARPKIPANREWISDVILRLLTGALNKLVKTLGMTDGDAISVVGRALFVRFLADRDLIPKEVAAFAPDGVEALFDAPASLIKVSKWLDDTFNGDFLPLTEHAINALPSGAFTDVGHILRRAPGGQFHLEWEESWARLDFAHIPVGILSQAYEGYLNTHKKEKQKKEGSYYTPRHIADLMVRASFSALRRDGVAHSAKVLDPAVGAGVFLITAFRQLVIERWRHDGKRPNTQTLREILETQITGFDINDSALRFAALGLYLMSIELDPEPEPVQKLVFKNLRKIGVLYKFGKDDGNEGSKDLGSLGDEVGPEHLGKYDLVIGNPPWAKATKLKGWKSVEQNVLRVARARLKDERAKAPLPNAVTDLPFVWRAMEWARPNGRISFALHARLLFLSADGMTNARQALFNSLDITGVINGTEIRQSNVWPGIAAPFCILLARNSIPGVGAGFRYLSPHSEGPLNHTGSWRIDPTQGDLITSEEIRRRPQLLKALFRGTRLDIELVDRIADRRFPTLGEYWAKNFGGTPHQAVNSGIGYKKLHKGSGPNPNEGYQLGHSAQRLFKTPVLIKSQTLDLVIDSSTYPLFEELGIGRLDRDRDYGIYQGPLLLVKESPPVKHSRMRCSVSFDNLVFNQSYHGYSGHAHDHGRLLIKYLSLFVGSKITLWHSLITSGRFGVEREVVEKRTIADSPMPPFEALTASQLADCERLFDALAHAESETKWFEVDVWLASLFGLTSDDVKVISDTLTFGLPFAQNQHEAALPAGSEAKLAFSKQLASDLQPWGKRFKRPLSVRAIPPLPLSPWVYAYIGKGDDTEAVAAFQRMSSISEATEGLGDRLSATEFIHVDEAGDCLILARLNQARYWSVSQARLVARRIIWEHVDFLSGKRIK